MFLKGTDKKSHGEMDSRFRGNDRVTFLYAIALVILFTGVWTWTSSATESSGLTPLVPDPAAAEAAQAELPAPRFHVADEVKQGEVLKIGITSIGGGFDNGSVWMRGKQVPLYKVSPTEYQALMPVDIFQKPGGYTLKIQDVNGITRFEDKVEVVNARYPIQNIRVSSSTQGIRPLPGELEAIGALKKRVSGVRYWDNTFVTPTPDCQNSPFGVKRYYNGKPSNNYHKGVDLRSPQGRPIKAANGGKVVISKMYRLHGGTVGIDHGHGVNSIYIHMSKINVKQGDVVKKGDVIGHVGSTGFATGPHLHWGLYVHGIAVNPNQWVNGVPKC